MMLSYEDRSDSVQSMTKTRYENDVTNHIGPLYVEKEIE